MKTTSNHPAVAKALGMNNRVEPNPHLQTLTVACHTVDPGGFAYS